MSLARFMAGVFAALGIPAAVAILVYFATGSLIVEFLAGFGVGVVLMPMVIEKFIDREEGK